MAIELKSGRRTLYLLAGIAGLAAAIQFSPSGSPRGRGASRAPAHDVGAPPGAAAAAPGGGAAPAAYLLTPAKRARLALGYGRNPFFSAPARSEPADRAAPAWRLTAVSLKGGSSFAVLNGRVVTVGDVVDGFRVIGIRAGSVTLGSGERTFSIALEGN